jgi:hypothetical protein
VTYRGRGRQPHYFVPSHNLNRHSAKSATVSQGTVAALAAPVEWT